LVQTEYFRIDRYATTAGFSDDVPGGEPRVLMILEGEGRITGSEGATAFGPMETRLLPAGMNECRLELDGEAVWLEVTFPQAASTQLA